MKKALLLAAYAPQHMEILWILSHPAFRGLLKDLPRLPFKYLEGRYLAHGFTIDQQAACFLHHYRKLRRAWPGEFLRRLHEGGVALWEMRDQFGCYTVTLAPSRLFQDEGEMSLHLRVDGEAVFTLAFTVIPGAVVESEARDLMLISRVHGVPGMFPQVQQATRAMHDVAPAALLMAALQGVAKTLGVDAMAGVTGKNQRSYTEPFTVRFLEAYDAFFTGLGATLNAAGFFVCPLPPPQKPFSQVKAGHKLRTREKRAFKQEVADRVCRAIEENCRPGTDRGIASAVL